MYIPKANNNNKHSEASIVIYRRIYTRILKCNLEYIALKISLVGGYCLPVKMHMSILTKGIT